MKRLLLIAALSLCYRQAAAQVSFGAQTTTIVIAATVIDTSGWQRVPSIATTRVRNTSDKVGIGLALPVSRTHLHQSAAYTSAAGLKLTTTNTGSAIGDGLNLYFESDNDLLFENRESAAISFLTSASTTLRLTAGGSSLFGMVSTDGTDNTGQVYALGGLTAVSGLTNASTIGLSVSGGTSNLSAGVTGSGTFLPLAMFANSAERARLTTDGDLLVGITSSDESFASEAILANSVVGSVTGTSNASAVIMGNIVGDQSFISATRTGAGSYLPLAFHTNANQRMTIATNGGITVGSPIGGSQGAGTINATAIYDDGVLLGAGGAGIAENYRTAMAWFSPASGGPDYVIESNEELYSFDATSAESLFYKERVSNEASSVDSFSIWIHVNSTAGDSGGFVLGHYARADGEATTGTFTYVAKQKDLGTSANRTTRITFSLSGIAPGDVVQFILRRDPNIANDVAAEIVLEGSKLWVN